MRDGATCSTGSPQIAHNLSLDLPTLFVDNLCINFLLQPCNDPSRVPHALYARGFLPTMKFQLSQLP